MRKMSRRIAVLVWACIVGALVLVRLTLEPAFLGQHVVLAVGIFPVAWFVLGYLRELIYQVVVRATELGEAVHSLGYFVPVIGMALVFSAVWLPHPALSRTGRFLSLGLGLALFLWYSKHLLWKQIAKSEVGRAAEIDRSEAGSPRKHVRHPRDIDLNLLSEDELDALVEAAVQLRMQRLGSEQREAVQKIKHGIGAIRTRSVGLRMKVKSQLVEQETRVKVQLRKLEKQQKQVVQRLKRLARAKKREIQPRLVSWQASVAYAMTVVLIASISIAKVCGDQYDAHNRRFAEFETPVGTQIRRVVHSSDWHMNCDPSECPAEDMALRIRDHYRTAAGPSTDAIFIHTGDVVHSRFLPMLGVPQRPYVLRIRHQIEETFAGTVWAAGNHDNCIVSGMTLCGLWVRVRDMFVDEDHLDALLRPQAVGSDVVVVPMDSTRAGSFFATGGFGRQLDELPLILKKFRDKKVILVFHHDPRVHSITEDPVGALLWGLGDGDRLFAIAARYRPYMVLYGHIHERTSFVRDGVMYHAEGMSTQEAVIVDGKAHFNVTEINVSGPVPRLQYVIV